MRGRDTLAPAYVFGEARARRGLPRKNSDCRKLSLTFESSGFAKPLHTAHATSTSSPWTHPPILVYV